MAEASEKELNSGEILELATKIVAAHVSNNEVGVSELPGLIEQVYKSLSATAKGTEPVQDKPVPAVSVSIPAHWIAIHRSSTCRGFR